MSGRDDHVNEVAACREKVLEIQELVGALSNECRTLVGMIESATGGDNCPTEAGRVATQEARHLEVAVTNEPNRTAEIIFAELVRYHGGF